MNNNEVNTDDGPMAGCIILMIIILVFSCIYLESKNAYLKEEINKLKIEIKDLNEKINKINNPL